MPGFVYITKPYCLADLRRQGNMKSRIYLLLILFAVCPAYSISTYFVDPNGNDTTGNGSIGNPWKTIAKALNVPIAAGDTIYMRGGTYAYTGSSTAITLSVSGTSPTNRCSLIGYNGERPVLDFSAMTGTGADGLKINGSYWYIKGIDCKGAPHNGIKISGGSYNTIEFCRSYENRNAGVQLAAGAAYNQIINCDSYYNFDPPAGGNADGFSPKLDVGTGNSFYGCRSWQNSDDAYDGYLRPTTGPNSVNTTYENCWAMKAGYLKDANSSVHGNGNGFKMGGGDSSNAAKLRHNVILKNCLAFANYAKGFDQNNNKGSMTLLNCTAFNNRGNNFSIPTSPLAFGQMATVTNCTSLPGVINLNSTVVQTTNDWSTTSSDFVSIDPAEAYGPRKADGSLPDITFMHLAADSNLIDAGTIDANLPLPYCGSAPDIGYFENCGNPPGQTTSPNPANGATGLSQTQDLYWTAGTGATSHDVYFGTAASPPLVSSGQTATTYDTGTMDSNTTYYWRIDEKNAGGTTTGAVWSFTIVHVSPNMASNPTPANSAFDVNLTQDLSWTAGPGATSHDVYFGTATSPPLVSSGQTATTYDTGTMASRTMYHWRIDENNAGGTTIGAVWNFTTMDNMPPTPNPMTWAIEPNDVSNSIISMTAHTASDISGVQYYFANTTDPNHDSNWVASPVWTDTGLTNNTKYSYKVKARDMSTNHNQTGWSNEANATTPRFVCTNSVSADLNGDCQVNILDYVRLADAWAGHPPMVDLNEDGVLNFKDLAKFALNWLVCNRTPAEECWK
jgi:hypothetical protein